MTNSQEVFCRNIVQGKSQRASLMIAFPKAKQWKISTIDSRASSLMKNENVQAKIQELQQVEDKKIKWSREKATQELLHILEIKEKEQDKIIEAYEQEIRAKEVELYKLQKEYKKTNKIEIKQEIEKLIEEIIELEKQPRIDESYNRIMLGTINILNKMYGIDKAKETINIEDEERENMKTLTKEELKEIVYYSERNKKV